MANYAFKSGTMDFTVIQINGDPVEPFKMSDLSEHDEKYILSEDDENVECFIYEGESADTIKFEDESTDTAEMFTGGRPPHRPW